MKDVGHRTTSSSSNLNLPSRLSGSTGTTKPQTSGDIVRATESALNLEQERLQKLKELEEASQSLKLRSNMDFSNLESHVARLIRQIRGTKESVSAKVSELVQIFQNASCPLSVSVAVFAKKVVLHCESPDDTAFACVHVIVLVTSLVPQAMDLILAELHRACIYTVPRHMAYLKSVLGSQVAYYKVIGYHEDNGKIESSDDSLERVESYMKLCGALVQRSNPT